jgi:adenine-specific DNA-methyltransferase
LFGIFDEPDIDILREAEGGICVHVRVVGVFAPSVGEARGDGPNFIVCWFIDITSKLHCS